MDGPAVACAPSGSVTSVPSCGTSVPNADDSAGVRDRRARRRRKKTTATRARTAATAAIVMPTAAPVEIPEPLEADPVSVAGAAPEAAASCEADVSEEDTPPGAEEVLEGEDGGLVAPEDWPVPVAELLLPSVELRVPFGEGLVRVWAEVLGLVVVEDAEEVVVLGLEGEELPEPSLAGITESPLCCHSVRELTGELKYWKVCEFPMLPSRL